MSSVQVITFSFLVWEEALIVWALYVSRSVHVGHWSFGCTHSCKPTHVHFSGIRPTSENLFIRMRAPNLWLLPGFRRQIRLPWDRGADGILLPPDLNNSQPARVYLSQFATASNLQFGNVMLYILFKFQDKLNKQIETLNNKYTHCSWIRNLSIAEMSILP